MPNTYTESMFTALADLEPGLDSIPAGSITGCTIVDGGSGYGAGTTLTVSASESRYRRRYSRN